MEIIEKGQCGEKVSYELYEDGTLKIFGVGEIYNYTDYTNRDKCSPFLKIKNEIKKAIISVGITSIGKNAFYGCDRLISIDLPDSISTIGYGSFSLCKSLQKIIIPNSVTTIKSSAFSYCKSLLTVQLGNSIISITSSLFEGCNKLQSIEIPNNITTIESSAFRGCTSLRFVNIPDNVTKIGDRAFTNCESLDTIKIGKNVAIIENIYEFKNCNNLTNIIVDERNEKYSSENGVLYNKNKSVLIKYPAKKTDSEFNVPESVVEIDNLAFSGCKFLKKIKISKNVIKLGDNSFYDCEKLRIVDIAGSIEKIGYDAFAYCYNIFSMSLKCEEPPILENDGALISIVKTAEIKVPKHSIHYYKAARGWNRFENYVALENE